jgi:fibronectin type 3 domain-containing protein
MKNIYRCLFLILFCFVFSSTLMTASAASEPSLKVNKNHALSIIISAKAGSLGAGIILPPTIDKTPPSTPANLRVLGSVLATSISLVWDASSDDVALGGYRVYRGGTLLSTQNETNFTDASVLPSQKYKYWIVAYDQTNKTSHSNYLLVTSASSTIMPPSVQNGVLIINPLPTENNGVSGDNSAVISWGKPSLRLDGSNITADDEVKHYSIYHGTVPGVYNEIIMPIAATDTEYNFTDLAAGAHYFVLTVTDSSGIESVLSNVVSKTIIQ